MKLFRFRGITVELHPTFYLLPIFVVFQGFADDGWRGAAQYLSAIVLVYTCVVLHEFGHALTARALGVSVQRIMLLPIGGMALMGQLPRRPAVELLVVAAGPAVNFLIVGICLALLGGWPPDWADYALPSLHFTGLLKFLLLSNLMLGCFNLLPVFPMDGGRLLRALLALWMDYLLATRRALVFGRVIAAIIIVLALLGRDFLLAVLFVFILIVGNSEYRYLLEEEMSKVPPLL